MSVFQVLSNFLKPGKEVIKLSVKSYRFVRIVYGKNYINVRKAGTEAMNMSANDL